MTPSPTFPADALIQAQSLNVRLGPQVRHPAVGSVGFGTPVALEARDHEAHWFVVRAPDGTTGWASGDFMEFRVDKLALPTRQTPTPLPPPTPTAVPMDPALPFVLDPPVASQGSVVLVRLRAPGASQTVASLDPQTVQLYPVDGERFAGVVPIPIDHPPGTFTVHGTSVGADGAPATWSADLTVRPGLFASEVVTLTGETMGLLEPTLRADELAYLNTIWSPPSPDRRWTGAWSSPMTATLSSSGFGATRMYNPGPVPGLHTGLDLRGRRGVPVYAPASGRVALAEPLRARGNTIVLDHGWGVYSAYFHLDSIAVPVGGTVEAGQPIGAVGSTGMVTGPHLHWEVRVLGQAVTPLQWLDGVGAPVP